MKNNICALIFFYCIIAPTVVNAMSQDAPKDQLTAEEINQQDQDELNKLLIRQLTDNEPISLIKYTIDAGAGSDAACKLLDEIESNAQYLQAVADIKREQMSSNSECLDQKLLRHIDQGATIDRIKQAIAAGVDINAASKFTKRPLWLFDIDSKDPRRLPYISLLLDLKGNVNAPITSANETALHTARSVPVLSFLITHKANIHARDNSGCTPLHAAVLDQRIDPVKELLAHKADVAAEDHAGRTPLDCVLHTKESATPITHSLLIGGAQYDSKNIFVKKQLQTLKRQTYEELCTALKLNTSESNIAETVVSYLY